jgi:site-specific DNA recombinase
VTESTGPIRCAVYTRKSTEEGLEQAFNSLDAQRESAEHFIASHAHQRWTCLPESYADGGYSGGNMDRPALQRLIAAVEAGEIDCVVVYRADRITRSLVDFAKIMEILQKHDVAFVSVTESFDTSQPGGRLHLHMMLSFAQYLRALHQARFADACRQGAQRARLAHEAVDHEEGPRDGRPFVR